MLLQWSRTLLKLTVDSFFLGRNGRPRRKLAGLTPAQAYLDAHPTPEQIEHARAHILELRRRQNQIRQSRERRADPIRLKYVREQLQRLGIDDPRAIVSLSIVGYSMDAITQGIAAFCARLDQKKLPIDCHPGAYLGSIIRNIDNQCYLERMAHYLLEQRIRAGDLHLEKLCAVADNLARTNHGSALLDVLINQALDADSVLAFRFWASRASDALASMPASDASALFPHLARAISLSRSAPGRHRERLIVALAKAAAPCAA